MEGECVCERPLQQGKKFTTGSRHIVFYWQEEANLEALFGIGANELRSDDGRIITGIAPVHYAETFGNDALA